MRDDGPNVSSKQATGLLAVSYCSERVRGTDEFLGAVGRKPELLHGNSRGLSAFRAQPGANASNRADTTGQRYRDASAAAKPRGLHFVFQISLHPP